MQVLPTDEATAMPRTCHAFSGAFFEVRPYASASNCGISRAVWEFPRGAEPRTPTPDVVPVCTTRLAALTWRES